MGNRHGLLLLVFLPLALLVYDMGRHVLINQGVPAFFVESRTAIQVALDGDWDGSGIYQISDGSDLISVIKMTELQASPLLNTESVRTTLLIDGERLIFQVVDNVLVGISRDWMPAAQRVALGIPLHPDRMSEEDWAYLPGIGERLAAAIEGDRQKNGDFRDLDALRRVAGIGSKRVESWKLFF